MFVVAGGLFFFGGRAITELTKTERLLAEGLGIGLAVVCAVIAMHGKRCRRDNLDDQELSPSMNDMGCASLLFPNCDVIRVGDADEVQQAGNNDEVGAIVRGSMRDHSIAEIERATHNVHSSRAHITDETQNVQYVPAVRIVNVALH